MKCTIALSPEIASKNALVKIKYRKVDPQDKNNNVQAAGQEGWSVTVMEFVEVKDRNISYWGATFKLQPGSYAIKYQVEEPSKKKNIVKGALAFSFDGMPFKNAKVKGGSYFIEVPLLFKAVSALGEQKVLEAARAEINEFLNSKVKSKTLHKLVPRNTSSEKQAQVTSNLNIPGVRKHFNEATNNTSFWNLWLRSKENRVRYSNLSNPESFASCKIMLDKLEKKIITHSQNSKFGKNQLDLTRYIISRKNQDMKIELEVMVPKYVATMLKCIKDAREYRVTVTEAVTYIYSMLLELTNVSENGRFNTELIQFNEDCKQWFDESTAVSSVIKNLKMADQYFKEQKNRQKEETRSDNQSNKNIVSEYLVEIKRLKANSKIKSNTLKNLKLENLKLENISDIEAHFIKALKEKSSFRKYQNTIRYENLKDQKAFESNKQALSTIYNLIYQQCYHGGFKLKNKLGGVHAQLCKSFDGRRDGENASIFIVPQHFKKILSLIDKAINYDITYQACVNKIYAILYKICQEDIPENRDLSTQAIYEQCKHYLETLLPDLLSQNINGPQEASVVGTIPAF